MRQSNVRRLERKQSLPTVRDAREDSCPATRIQARWAELDSTQGFILIIVIYALC